jgi:tetratricopeptide (TPR) repeat protein
MFAPEMRLDPGQRVGASEIVGSLGAGGIALRLNQNHAPAHVVLAMINYGHGRYDGALGEAQKAVSLDSRHSRAWRELGRANLRLGRREEAERLPDGGGARSQRLDGAQQPGCAVFHSQSAG